MSQKIIKNREIIEDTWVSLDDEAPLPAGADVIVSFQRWQQDGDALKAHDGRLGICIGDGVAVDEILGDLSGFALIAIEFPAFKDGRGYSYARLLRERYSYEGEIRAVGNVLRDQLLYMYRCGFDAFAVEAGRDINDALNAFDEFSVHYQPAAH